LVWSWGAHGWTNIENKCLRFKVRGHHFKGYVHIIVNGLDLFDVFYVSTHGNIKDVSKDVYIEDLVDTIDIKVERIPEYVR
jgi:hypothetical protein